MQKILGSKRVAVALGILAVLSWTFAYFVGFTYTGIDRAAYERGEEVYTIGLGYFGPRTYGPYESRILADLTFQAEDGRTLTPEEMVGAINPNLNPYVEVGVVYLHEPARTEWGRQVYWTSPNPVTVTLANIHRFLRNR